MRPPPPNTWPPTKAECHNDTHARTHASPPPPPPRFTEVEHGRKPKILISNAWLTDKNLKIDCAYDHWPFAFQLVMDVVSTGANAVWIIAWLLMDFSRPTVPNAAEQGWYRIRTGVKRWSRCMLGQQDTQQWTGEILCRWQLGHLLKNYFNSFILWFLLLLLASGNLVVFTVKTVKGKWILPPKTSPPTASLAGQISFLSSFVASVWGRLFVAWKRCFHRKFNWACFALPN